MMLHFEKDTASYWKLRSITLAVIGTILLLFPALYNGYPLVNSDDGTYISSGFKIERPGDRPISYGLFLHVFSLNGYSLWIAIFVQTFILSWLLLVLLQLLTDEHKLVRNAVVMYVLLALTSASWTVSEIVPDIWTAIALLSFTIIFIAESNSRINTVFLYGIYFLAIATHMSNIMIFTGLAIVLLVSRRFFFQKHQIKTFYTKLLTLFVVSWATFPLMSFSYHKSKHVFLMASLVEKGVLKEYLADKCAEKEYGICQYRSVLPDDPNVFLWNGNSPLYLQGGWDATKEEYSVITSDLLTTPHYSWLFLKQSFIYSARQLLVCHLAEGNFPFPKESHVYSAIAEYVPRDTSCYAKAWQHESNIVDRLSAMNNINYLLTVLSVISIPLLLVIKRRKINAETRLMIFLFVAGYLINIVDCATFAQINARYSSRLMWVLPLGAYILILQANKKFNTR